MERDYFSLGTRAAPARTLERLADEIRRCQLGEEVPLIMIEKNLKGVNRSQEFYLVLVVDTKNGMLSDELSSLVRTVFGRPKIEKVSRDEARRFANVGLDFIDNVVLIPFDPPRTVLLELPNLLEQDEIVSPQPINEQNVAWKYQNLLYLLSFNQSGTYLSFQKACVNLGLIGEDETCRSLARRLRLLGHIEFAMDGNHWAISPSCLVYRIVEEGQIRAHLCGQRAVRLIESIQSKSSGEEELMLQPDANGPPIVFFNFENLDQLIKTQTSLEGPIPNLTPATQLAEILPKLTDWKSGLPIAEGITPALYAKRIWQDGKFIEVHLAQKSGFYELSRNESEHGNSSYFYYDKNSDNWLQGEWYGLRFVAISENEQVKAFFAGGRLAIPLAQRWPYLYEKSLVLISGSLPEYIDDWLVYYDVPGLTAETLCEKLGVELERK